jgi:transposase-like protein
MNKNRKRYDGEFKLNCVKLVINSKGERTMKEIAQDLVLHYRVLADWKKKYEKYGENAFVDKKPTNKELKFAKREFQD